MSGIDWDRPWARGQTLTGRSKVLTPINSQRQGDKIRPGYKNLEEALGGVGYGLDYGQGMELGNPRNFTMDMDYSGLGGAGGFSDKLRAGNYVGAYGNFGDYMGGRPSRFDRERHTDKTSIGGKEIASKPGPTPKTGGFFGGGKGIGLNKETLDLGMAAYGLYGDWQDRERADRAEGRAIDESARIGKYAAVNLANKGNMINFNYENLRNWMDVNDPNKERYTRPTNVATSI